MSLSQTHYNNYYYYNHYSLTVACGWTAGSTGSKTTSRRAGGGWDVVYYLPDDALPNGVVGAGRVHAWRDAAAMMLRDGAARWPRSAPAAAVKREYGRACVLSACRARPGCRARPLTAWDRLRTRLVASMCVRVCFWALCTIPRVQLAGSRL